MSDDRQANGIETIPSRHSVSETVERLKKTLDAKGVKVFAVIDHSGEAEKAGLQMPDTKLVIFGNPKAGTPVMLTAPLIAIDLPLKILVWEGADGKTWISYTKPDFLQERYGLPAEVMGPLSGVTGLANAIAQ